MFGHILDHFARRHAARQRSEVHCLKTRIAALQQQMQQEEDLFHTERSCLLDHLIERDRTITLLEKENTGLQRFLETNYRDHRIDPDNQTTRAKS